MSVNAYFLTSLFPDEIYPEIINLSKGAIANANNELQWSLVLGLNTHYQDFLLINFPNVGAYPFRYKTLYMNGCDIRNQGEILGHSYSFINILYFKHFFKYLKVLQVLRDKLKHSKESDKHIFFVYDLYSPFLKALSVIKRDSLNENIHICLIVPDINGMTGSKKSFINDYVLKRDANTISSSYKQIDSFVLLSKYMIDFIPVGNKPWIVVEGILNYDKIEKIRNSNMDFNLLNNIKLDDGYINILYSGAIDERNGIINLLEAFKLIDNDVFRLVICGDGPLKSLVQNYVRKDKRVVYLGQLPNNYIIKLQSKVNLLVNPRLPGQEFTKYSFPSKTIEYFSSGTPTLMYRLEGVPDEYFNHCFVVENSSIISVVENLKQKILEIFELPSEVRRSRAYSARSFVINNKNSEYQCKKIYELVLK